MRYLFNMLKFIFVGIGLRLESIIGDMVFVWYLLIVFIIMVVFVFYFLLVWFCYFCGRISY